MSDDDEESKDVWLFDRNVAEIPCFRNSFLYGLLGGAGTGLAYFMFTSRVSGATNAAYSGFFLITLSYWFTCRYNYSKTKFQMLQVQSALQENILLEGTGIDNVKDEDFKEV